MQQPYFEINDFIGYFPKSIDPNFCDFLCSYMDKAEQVQGRRYTHVKDKQICLDAFSPGEAKDLMNGINGCLYYYIRGRAPNEFNMSKEDWALHQEMNESD